MNRLTRVALSLLAVAAAGSPCVAQAGRPSGGPPPPPAPAAEYGAKAWRDLTSPGGRFSVRVPAPPKPDRQEIDTPLGKLLAYFETAETSAGMYAVVYCDFPNHLES